MAGTKFGGKNGAVTISGIGGDFFSQNIRVRQDIEDASAYGTGEWAEKGTSGLKDLTLQAEVILKFNAANMSPGLVDISDTPVAFTCTLTTGCSISGNLLITEGSINQTRRSGTTRMSITGESTGTVTETWDETA
jgi:hypothetical protein